MIGTQSRWKALVATEIISTCYAPHTLKWHRVKLSEYSKASLHKRYFAEKPSVKKELWGGEFWTDGYYVATVGERANWDTVERYVKNQGHTGTTLRQLKLF